MSTRKTPLIVGEVYHIYNRGIDKRKICSTENEFQRFIEYMDLSRFDMSLKDYSERGYEFFKLVSLDKKQLVEIIGFCVLDNHFHIIVRQLEENGITKFMQRLGTAYTMYFNHIKIGLDLCSKENLNLKT